MKQLTLPVIVIGLSLCTGALLYPWISASRERRSLESEVFAPYFAAIGQGHWEDAWSMHTAAWRSRHSLTEFTSHLLRESLSSQGGVIIQHEVLKARMEGPGVRAECQVLHGSRSDRITFDLVPPPKAGGHPWEIESTDPPGW